MVEEKLAQLQKKLESDKGLGEKLFSLETPEEVQSLLKEQGLEFSLEEIEVLGTALVKYLEKGESGELSDDDLEDVAGGFVITFGVLSAIGAVAGALFSAGKFTHEVSRGRW